MKHEMLGPGKTFLKKKALFRRVRVIPGDPVDNSLGWRRDKGEKGYFDNMEIPLRIPKEIH